MTSALSAPARAAVQEVQTAVTRLQAACDSAFFSDDSDVCSGVAAAGQNFVSNVAPPLLAQIDTGDFSAVNRFVDVCGKIRDALVDEATRTNTDLSMTGQFERFLQEVVVQTGVDASKDLTDAAKKATSIMPYVAVGAGIFALAWLAGKAK